MENKKKENFMLIIPLALFVLMYLCFFFANSNKLKKLKTYTSKTEGIVTRYTTHSKSTSGKYKQTKHYHDITVTYTVNGKIHSNENEYPGKNGEIFEIGEQITILYDPTDSEKIIPEKIAKWQEKNYKQGRVCSVILIVITGAFFGFIAYNIKPKKKTNN